MVDMAALLTHSVPLVELAKKWGELAGASHPIAVSVEGECFIAGGTQEEMQTLQKHFLSAHAKREKASFSETKWLMILNPKREERDQEIKAGIMAQVPPGAFLSPVHIKLLNTIVLLWERCPAIAREQERLFLDRCWLTTSEK